MVDDLFDISDDGTPILRVHAQPGAGRTAVSGRYGDALKVRVAAPPEGGRANDALVKYLAELFGLKAAQVVLTGGAANRSKRFQISGLEGEEFRRLLQGALDGASPDRQAAPRRLRGH